LTAVILTDVCVLSFVTSDDEAGRRLLLAEGRSVNALTGGMAPYVIRREIEDRRASQ
jgi:hypothetical protein